MNRQADYPTICATLLLALPTLGCDAAVPELASVLEPSDTIVFVEVTELTLATSEFAIGEVASVSLMGDSAVLIADAQGGQIVALDLQGNLISLLAEPGPGPGETDAPRYAMQAPDGRFFALTRGLNGLAVFGEDGAVEGYATTNLSGWVPWHGRISPDGERLHGYVRVGDQYRLAVFHTGDDVLAGKEVRAPGLSDVAPRRFEAPFVVGGERVVRELRQPQDVHLALTGLGSDGEEVWLSADPTGIHVRRGNTESTLPIPLWRGVMSPDDVAAGRDFYALHGAELEGGVPRVENRAVYSVSIHDDGWVWAGMTSRPALQFLNVPSLALLWDGSTKRVIAELPFGVEVHHPFFDISGALAVGVRFDPLGEASIVVMRTDSLAQSKRLTVLDSAMDGG